MKAMLDAVTKDALALPADEQESLAEKLVGNLMLQASPEIKRRQLAEVMRRREEILGGKVAGISVDQVIREIEALVH